MTQLKTEFLWGATIVMGTGVAVLLGLGEAGAFVVTMLLVAISLTHISKRYGLGQDPDQCAGPTDKV